MSGVIWSPDLLYSGKLIPRWVVAIPQSHRKLLDRPDAFSTRGIPNAHPSVLEGVRKWHTLKQAADPFHPSTAHQTTKENQQTDNDCDSDEEGTDISWESSPPEHRNGPAPLAKAPRDLVNRVIAHSSPTPTRKRNLLNSEPKPARVPGYVQARFSLPLDQPVSSLASADDALEVEVPKAVAPPSRTTAKEACGIPLEPTPPSAQVIPSTYTDTTQERLANPPQPTRQRLMKDPNKAWSRPMPRTPASPAVVSTRTPALNQPGPSSTPVNLSGNPRPKPTCPSAKGGITPSHLGNAVQIDPGIDDTTHEARSSGSERVPPNGPPSQVPYTAFRLAYADFQANKNDFIRALLCLKQIRKNKSIARFLYDDFVRVFCCDYMHYITLDTESHETLTPAKWYNEYVKTPRYLKGLLTPENLQEALDQYPSEAEYLSNQAKGRVSLKKDVNPKDAAATSANNETTTPTSENRISNPPPKLSTAPESIPQQGPSHTEIASDPIGLRRPAARSPLGPSTANSASTRDSARTNSVSTAVLTQPPSPELLLLSPSTKENEPPNRYEQEARSKVSTRRQPPSFKLHPPAPPPAPPQMSRSSDHRHQEPPVVIYGRKHSLPTELLRSTDAPLSQQSDADSIAEPKRKKRRSKRDADGRDLGFARFLQSASSTPARSQRA